MKAMNERWNKRCVIHSKWTIYLLSPLTSLGEKIKNIIDHTQVVKISGTNMKK